MFKEWLKQFLAMCICVITLLSSISPAFAEDYVKNDSDGDANYYIIEGKDVDTLFDFGLYDVGDIVDWIFQFKTFTVIKKYTDRDGNLQYKMYFNTPNLQSILKNRVISLVDDGYTDDTYDVDDTEWVVDVGLDAPDENVITKYGFQVPSYTYMGEYPKEVMSTAGILPNPKKWYEVLWRFIKSIFGVSFIKAPDADNFNTITYLNHTYSDKNDYILEFFKEYYLDYFERKIPIDNCDNGDEYFNSPEEVISMAVTQDAYDKAVQYNNEHLDQYNEALERYAYWDVYESNGHNAAALTSITQKVGNKQLDSWHFLASIEKYRDNFKTWAQSDLQTLLVLSDAFMNEGGSTRRRWGNNGAYMSFYRDYKIYDTPSFTPTEANMEEVSTAADILRYSEPHLLANISYTCEHHQLTYQKTTNYNYYSTDGGNSWNSAGTTSGGSTTPVDVYTYTYPTEQVSFADTAAWRDYLPNSYNTTYSLDGQNSTSTEVEDSRTETITGNTKQISVTYNVTTEYDDYYHYHIVSLQGNSDASNGTTSWSNYNTFLENCNYDFMEYDEADFVPNDLQVVHDNFELNADLIARYEEFNTLLANGADQDSSTDKVEILYRQCMITNDPDAEDEECWSKEFGEDKTSLTIVNVYAFSRIYTVTQDVVNDSSVHKLNNAQAHEILSLLQSYCGPYYPQVIGNMMKLMCATAKHDGDNGPNTTVVSDDKRVMPYDTASMLAKDRENYDVTDPRVDLYKSHIVGKLVSNFNFSFAIGIYFKPQKSLINIAGKITEISVFMQQLCNFGVFESYGLSPADMWTSAYTGLLMAMIALFFIIKTVASIIKMGTNAGARLVVAFLLLVFELGLITAIAANPTRVWNTIKNVENKMINLGEMSTVYSVPSLTYLYGNSSDMEVTYYMPYLDTWSKYNTGYGILESQQLMNTSTDSAELVDKDFPKIGSNEIKHYSVLLMDSFSYWGYSNSISNTVTVNGHTYNGSKINNNAYRVVDHFMAPRVDITELNGGNKMSISVTENENYNGQFQSGLVDVIVKLMNCCLCCLLSFIKFMTFLWQWFMLYIFIFKIILGRGAENKKMTTILIEVFSPTLAMIGIGLYTGAVMIMGMTAEGLAGIVLEIFLFWLTFMIIRWWHDLSRNAIGFPQTLVPVYMLTNLSEANRRRMADKARREAREDALDAGMGPDWDKKTLDEQREELFDDNGKLKSIYANDPTKTKVISNWYERAYNTDRNSRYSPISEQTRNAMRNLESDDCYRDGIKKFKDSYNPDKETHIDQSMVGIDHDEHGRGKNKHNQSGKINGTASTVSDAVSSMYGDNEPGKPHTDDEPGKQHKDSEDDYGRTKSGSGEYSDRRSAPKKIGASDNDQNDNNSKGDANDED